MKLTPPSWRPFPWRAGELDAYRIRAWRRARYAGSGSHLTRRRGQSLEFRDFVPYTPGDDVRYIDWRASLRYRSQNDLLVRQFQAEERMTFIISLDAGPTMWLPQALPKLLVAWWLAQTMAWIALSFEERVYLHLLFGEKEKPMVLAHPAQRRHLSQHFSRWAERIRPTDSLNLAPLYPLLKPATVWILITDLYFADSPMADARLSAQATSLARLLKETRRGYCWNLWIDLDSWPFERKQLEEGAYRIEGPGLREPPPAYEISATALAAIQQRIDAMKASFITESDLPATDVSHWRWPTEHPSAEAFFRRQFMTDAILEQLFQRTP